MFIENTEAVLLCVSMRGIWYCSLCCQVVEPVEVRLVGGGVEAANEQVDVVGRSGAERAGQFATNEV